MSELIKKLEDILKQHVADEDIEQIDLSDDDCVYRKFYFDSLPEDAARDALFLFPYGQRLYHKYSEILKGVNFPNYISDLDLCALVGKYLNSTVSIMDDDEDKEAIKFINSIDGVEPYDVFEPFDPGKNLLHKFVYGSITEFIINELPDDDSLWLLYDWSLEKTKWATVSAYLLEDFFDNSFANIFKPGFELWFSRNSNRYWAEGNTFNSKKVFCSAQS